MHEAGPGLPGENPCHRPSRAAAASLALALLAPFGAVPAAPAAAPQDGYKLEATASPPPDGIDPTVVEHVQGSALTVLTADDEPLMDLWFARTLPAPATPPGHPGVAYGTLNEGVVLAVMRLHRPHNDFRDQEVGAGVYLVRYLRQPDDGNHLGETTYRDFAVLTEPDGTSVGPQGFQETLDQALELNLHPFAWGLWPPEQVESAEIPGLVAFQPDKWALKTSLPRADGTALPIALVVVGNEWHY